MCQAVIVIDVSIMNLLSWLSQHATQFEAVINQVMKSSENRFGGKKFLLLIDVRGSSRL